MAKRFFRSLTGFTLLLLALLIACRDPQDSVTSGTALYVYDGSAGVVQIWDDLQALYDNGASQLPTRKLSGSLIQDKVKILGIGGMAFDVGSSRLYLISESGDVVRIERADKQNGALSASADIVSFKLDAGSDRWSDGVFSQAAVDRSTGTLLVMERNASDARIWVVASPGSYGEGASVSLQKLVVSGGGDSGGMGVAFGSGGTVYGYFTGGKTIYQGGTSYTGPRLRSGSTSGFPLDQQVIVGPNTHLGSAATLGSLAMDTDLNRLYVLSRQNPAGTSTDPALLVFRAGTFNPGFNTSPDATLGTLGEQPDLQLIVHGGSRDWLLGVTGAKLGAPSAVAYLWKAPSQGGAPKTLDLSSVVDSLRGAAIVGAQ